MKKLFFILAAFLLVGQALYSQVGIYPQAVFLDPQHRSSNLKVMNSSDQPKEVTIDLKFGYPGYDSTGKVVTIYGDTLPEAKYSAAPFVKVFPKKLILKAKEEQIVRFMLGNVGELPDGTYFGRIMILSKNPPEEIDTTYKEEITAKIDLQFTLVSALIVGKGKKDCSLKLNGGSAYADSASVYIVAGFERGGNSPFLGTAEMNVYDMNGSQVATTKEVTPIYFNSKKAFKFEKSKFRKGKYKVEVIMSSEHKDIPDEFKVPFETYKASFVVDIEGNI